MDKSSKILLTAVLSLPTTSFHEWAIAAFVRWYAAGIGLKIREDKAGNILITCCKGKKEKPSVVFVAHMDHPGFEVISRSGKKVKVVLWGRIRPETFMGSKVVTYTKNGPVKGRIAKKKLAEKFLGAPCFFLESTAEVERGDFGHYDLRALEFSRGLIKTRAADNLASVAAILDLMTRLVANHSSAHICGLFTRAEEVGFVGSFAAIESGIIPKKTPIVVLECSSAAGGKVDIGGGPVVRAGDLHSTFDPEVEAWISQVAGGLTKNTSKHRSRKPFTFQRALLQGGRCEAAALISQGLITGGLALPLGNYHNQATKGFAQEYVSISDYEGLIELLTALSTQPMKKEVLRTKALPLLKNYQTFRKKLIGSR